MFEFSTAATVGAVYFGDSLTENMVILSSYLVIFYIFLIVSKSYEESKNNSVYFF